MQTGLRHSWLQGVLLCQDLIPFSCLHVILDVNFSLSCCNKDISTWEEMSLLMTTLECHSWMLFPFYLNKISQGRTQWLCLDLVLFLD